MIYDPSADGRFMIYDLRFIPGSAGTGDLGGIFRYSPLFVHFIAPGGQKSDKHSFFFGLFDNPVHMGKIFLVGACRVVVDQRLFSFCIGSVQPIGFGQNYSLDGLLYSEKSKPLNPLKGDFVDFIDLQRVPLLGVRGKEVANQ